MSLGKGDKLMPNWVYNNLSIEGTEEAVARVKAQLNKPIVKQYEEEKIYSNPIISFWNIIAPPADKLEEYFDTHGFADGGEQGNTEYNWYNFNNSKWGTKWDIAKSDSADDWNATEITSESATHISYRFDTAWSPPLPVIEELSVQYPELAITLDYEEEQGWGGEILWTEEGSSIIREYDIPESHADFLERDNLDGCSCTTEEDQDYWYKDCPREAVLELQAEQQLQVVGE
jgi:hypothetical protein